MPKPGHRPRRRRAAKTPARTTSDQRGLLERILDTPNLARAVPRLAPDVLHRVIHHCGLEDCTELVALATPGQLAAVFDLDLWRATQAGRDERFDAARFGAWLEVLLESGAGVAAQALADANIHLVIAAFAQHVRVFDVAAGLSPDGVSCELGGYAIVARHTGSLDAIVAVLNALDAEHADTFHRVMRGCRRLSNSKPEIDGLDDLLTVDDQAMFDLAFEREQRREQQGYVTPEQARAFLEMSREVRRPDAAEAPVNPIARACFRAVESTPPMDTESESCRLRAAEASIVDVLLEAGVLPQRPRALLEAPRGAATRLARVQVLMQFAAGHDAAAFSLRGQELAFLANVLVAGCSIQARAFTPQEASDAAVATCNLGLENWPTALSDDFLVGHDLVTVFQAGWSVLHRDVCMYTAERLIDVLAGLQCVDEETQSGLDALRVEMANEWQAGTPWRASEALDVMTILDMPAWASLLGLIAECPVIHAGLGASQDSRVRAVSASAFEFISENSQIASVREFMVSLPKIGRDA